MISDAITTLGEGVDGAVQALARSFTVRGQVATLSSGEIPEIQIGSTSHCV